MTTMAHDLARSRGFLVVEDVELIMEAVRSLPHERLVLVVDLGAGSGTTALAAFCERPEAMTVVTVDHDQVAIDSTRQLLTNAGYVQNWHNFLGKTQDVAGLMGSYVGVQLFDPIDMLMVDAGHKYEDVKADLEAWLPFVKPGAPVWMHDYTPDYHGCIKAIDEAIADGRLIAVKMAGWGILCRKAVAL